MTRIAELTSWAIAYFCKKESAVGRLKQDRSSKFQNPTVYERRRFSA